MNYQDFLASKKQAPMLDGFPLAWMPEIAFPFQRAAIEIACNRGRCALFESPGLGKTIQQLIWVENARRHTGMPVLIVAPLAVTKQTCREASDKLGLDCKYVRHQSECTSGINITNYEMLEHFNPTAFGAIVLDESGILKGYSGKFRKFCTQFAQQIEYRLPCTATPAPNDLIELINHAEFLSVLRIKEAIAMFFIQDGNTTHKWRLKGHAKKDFWQWVASWAVAIEKPSDIGPFDDTPYKLPRLNIHKHITDGTVTDGYLIPMEAITLDEQRRARRESMPDRVKKCAEIVSRSDGQVLLWCDLNDESQALCEAIPDAVEVTGSMDPEVKADRLWQFAQGEIQYLVTKKQIAGFGLNFQHTCHTDISCGLSHSYEMFFQALRRIYRFGQPNEVNSHIVASENEMRVLENIERKERQVSNMMREIIAHMNQSTSDRRNRAQYSGADSLQLPAFLKG